VAARSTAAARRAAQSRRRLSGRRRTRRGGAAWCSRTVTQSRVHRGPGEQQQQQQQQQQRRRRQSRRPSRRLAQHWTCARRHLLRQQCRCRLRPPRPGGARRRGSSPPPGRHRPARQSRHGMAAASLRRRRVRRRRRGCPSTLRPALPRAQFRTGTTLNAPRVQTTHLGRRRRGCPGTDGCRCRRLAPLAAPLRPSRRSRRRCRHGGVRPAPDRRRQSSRSAAMTRTGRPCRWAPDRCPSPRPTGLYLPEPSFRCRCATGQQCNPSVVQSPRDCLPAALHECADVPASLPASAVLLPHPVFLPVPTTRSPLSFCRLRSCGMPAVGWQQPGAWRRRTRRTAPQTARLPVRLAGRRSNTPLPRRPSPLPGPQVYCHIQSALFTSSCGRQ